jgi:Ca2+-binding RTX toxin-like protein
MVTEGQPLPLVAGRLGGNSWNFSWLSNSAATNAWDLNGDGIDDVSGDSPAVSWSLLQSLGIMDGSSTFTLTQHMTVTSYNPDPMNWDPPNISHRYFNAPVVVLNAPPTAGITGPTSVQRGQSTSFTLLATDPSSSDQDAGFTFAIDWDGDGTVDETTTGMSGMQIQHVFDSSGTTNIKVTATDKDGGVSDIASTTVAVLGYDLIAGTLYWYGSQGNDHVQFEQLDPSTVRITESMINGLSVSQSWDVAGVTGIVNANGRQGSDLIDGSFLMSISTFINGGDQSDSLIGGGANDTIWGGTGNDSIQGVGGDDSLYGEYAASSELSLKMASLGTDTIDGGDGVDLIFGDGDGGEGAADVIDGGDGDDTILGDGAEGSPNTAGDTIHGGAGVDRIKGDGTYGSADQIFGDAGDDFIDAAGGNDLVDGGDGNDILFGGDGAEGAADSIIGGDGNDILVGDGSASPVTSQRGGADSLDGGSGQDIIIAGIVLQTSTTTIDFLSIRAEWLGGHTFSQKIDNINGTGGTGVNGSNYLLPGVNTFDDKSTPTPAVVDQILGGSDEDWMIINETEDATADVSSADLLTDLSIFPFA